MGVSVASVHVHVNVPTFRLCTVGYTVPEYRQDENVLFVDHKTIIIVSTPHHPPYKSGQHLGYTSQFLLCLHFKRTFLIIQ